MIIKSIVITMFIILCLSIISEKINKKLEKELYRQKEINMQLVRLFQNEQVKSESFYKIMKNIKKQITLLGLSSCPQEDFNKIAFKIIGWIEQIENIKEGEKWDT